MALEPALDEPCAGAHLVLVERLALEQRARQRVEVRAVLGEQAVRLAGALLDDAAHLGSNSSEIASL